MNTEQILFFLLRSEICGESTYETVERSLLRENLSEIYRLANKHDLVHIAGQALGNLGLLDSDELSKMYKTATKQAYTTHRCMESEYRQICRDLDEAQIPFVPLKGAPVLPRTLAAQQL